LPFGTAEKAFGAVIGSYRRSDTLANWNFCEGIFLGVRQIPEVAQTFQLELLGRHSAQ